MPSASSFLCCFFLRPARAPPSLPVTARHRRHRQPRRSYCRAARQPPAALRPDLETPRQRADAPPLPPDSARRPPTPTPSPTLDAPRVPPRHTPARPACPPGIRLAWHLRATPQPRRTRPLRRLPPALQHMPPYPTPHLGRSTDQSPNSVPRTSPERDRQGYAGTHFSPDANKTLQRPDSSDALIRTTRSTSLFPSRANSEHSHMSEPRTADHKCGSAEQRRLGSYCAPVFGQHTGVQTSLDNPTRALRLKQ
jgi:hypothetical protein